MSRCKVDGIAPAPGADPPTMFETFGTPFPAIFESLGRCMRLRFPIDVLGQSFVHAHVVFVATSGDLTGLTGGWDSESEDAIGCHAFLMSCFLSR